ncbi:MAG: quinone-dependent dihydroorotate dehydrogenase [Armatimonadota bacterium]|nr:quinone-dependent dihydroorotate dehydrogenase [Armatimonadota bacterium]
MRIHAPLFWLPPEAAHAAAVATLELVGRRPALRRLLRARLAVANPLLETTCFGLRFPNPLGVAAGFDKDGRAVAALESLGFGFIEVGTVTPRPQPGNEGPRLARLPAERALVNRLGFPSEGAGAVAARLARTPRTAPLGINVGRNKATEVARSADDYIVALRTLYAVGDYFVVNISSPNTPGLRDLHRGDLLGELLAALRGEIGTQAARVGAPPKPFLLKVSPDLPEASLDEIAGLVIRHGAAGVVVANTTVDSPLIARANVGGGGLSGAPIRALVRRLVREFRRRLRGRAEVVGVGGVFGADDAYAMLRAGASLVQVYTGFVYEGPGMAGRVCRGLVALLARDGVRSVREIVGVDA